MTMKKIKVLQFTNGVFLGGVIEHVRIIASAIDYDKFEVIIICKTEEIRQLLKEKLKDYPAQIICVNIKDKFDIGGFKTFLNFVKQQNADILHIHLANIYSPTIVSLSGLFRKLKVFWTIHSTHVLPTTQESLFRYKTIERASRLTQHVIAPSKAIVSELRGRFNISGEKIVYVQNGVDVIRFHPEVKAKREELKITPDVVVIGTTGCLNPEKDHYSIIKAFKQVAEKYNHVKLLIVGTGLLDDKLKQFAEDLGIRKKVIFTGYRLDIPEMLASMDIFIFASTNENMPLSVLEAMAMAKPIITTNAGGISEIITNDQTGWIVPMHSAASIVEKIIYCMENKTKASELGKNARQLVLEKYTNTRMVETLERLYLQCGLG